MVLGLCAMLLFIVPSQTIYEKREEKKNAQLRKEFEETISKSTPHQI